jgi:acylphosphatase
VFFVSCCLFRIARVKTPNKKPETKNYIMESKRIIVQGIVQGVGFRPFIYRLAQQYGITGTVSNNAHGVEIEAEGEHASIQSFIQSINHSAPPLALIDKLKHSIFHTKDSGFYHTAEQRKRRPVYPHLPRRDRMRRLPDRIIRPERPSPPISVY